MEEPKTLLAPGTRILTHETLGSTTGMLIVPDKLANRKPNQKATLGYYVAGHGGGIYWAKHDQTDEVAAYGWMEFELLVEP